MKKVVAVLLAAMLILAPTLNVSVQATEGQPLNNLTTGENAKITTSSFKDNSVIVFMTNEASLSKFQYNTSDFSAINCKSVTNLSHYTTEKVEMLLSKNTELTNRTSDNDELHSELETVDLSMFNQVLCLELEQTGKDNVMEAIKLLEQHPDVLCAGPNYTFTLENEPIYSVPDIPSYLPENSLRSVTTKDPYAYKQWAISAIGLSDAWAVENGTNNRVVVGIIDGGIDASHPDFNANGRQRVDANKSQSFDDFGRPSSESAIEDEYGHGTMVAGVIGAYTNNNKGISGVNWNIDMVSLRLIPDQRGNYSMSQILSAIEYADEQGIEILNISGAATIDLSEWREQCTANNPYPECIKHRIEQYPGLIICAAGNTYDNLDNIDTYYPTSYDFWNIIVVGASTRNDVPWIGDLTDDDPKNDGSNFGQSRVDLFAPGHEIYSCFPLSLNSNLGGYAYDTGTSFAAPYVTGVISLIWAKYPNLSAEEVKRVLMNSVEMKPAYLGKCVTGGRLNAYCAIHDHNSLLGCDYNDSLTHMGYCDCGARWYETHYFVNIGDMDYCTGCGYVII